MFLAGKGSMWRLGGGLVGTSVLPETPLLLYQLVSYSLPSLVFEGAEVLSMLGVPEVEA